MTDPTPHPFALPEEAASAASPRVSFGMLEWRQTFGGGLIGIGLVAVVLAWWGISGAADPAEQMPYFASGGVGGAALVGIGIAMLVSYEHARDRAAMRLLFEEIQELKRLQQEAGDTDATVVERLSQPESPARKGARGRPIRSGRST